MSENTRPVGSSGANTLEAVVAAAHETAGAFTTLERQLRHSRSFHDVQAVDAGHALAPPPLKKLRKSRSGCSLLDSSLKAVQEDENEVAEVVVVCEPEGEVELGETQLLLLACCMRWCGWAGPCVLWLCNHVCPTTNHSAVCLCCHPVQVPR